MTTPHWQDGGATLYVGGAMDVLAGLPAASVQCVVTSPPYYQLRSYGTDPQIWDAVPGCDHEWASLPRLVKSGGAPGAMLHATPAGAGSAKFGADSGECRRCGAWWGELGGEPTPERYVGHLVAILGAVRRVLRPDGTLWLNLGDSYAGSWGNYAPGGITSEQRPQAPGGERWERPAWADTTRRPATSRVEGVDDGNLLGVPWRVAFALQADGWRLRSDNIWFKRNPMPESVQGWRWERHRIKVGAGRRGAPDRKQNIAQAEVGAHGQGGRAPGSVFDSRAQWEDCPGCAACTPNDGLVLRRGSGRTTRAHEYVFMLARSDAYFFDTEAVKETGTQHRQGAVRVSARHKFPLEQRNGRDGTTLREEAREDRNMRSVWDIPTRPYAGAHFAVFPAELPARAVAAGTSERGCCAACGSPWARIVRRTPAVETLGWRPTCTCGAPAVPCVVLDPFAGSGTTGEAALVAGRRFVGIELNAGYAELAVERLGRVSRAYRLRLVDV